MDPRIECLDLERHQVRSFRLAAQEPVLELVERELRASEALLGVRSLPIEAHQLVYNLVLQLEAPGQPEDLTVAAYGLVTGDLSVQRRLSGKGLMARLTDWEGSSR